MRKNRLPYDRMCVRPVWSRCADYMAGGAERWKTLSEGKTSNQLVGVLLNELQSHGGGSVGEEAAYFDGLVSI